jgi:Bacterial Ig-like domain (group 3)/FG-GAP-like repeat/FG-GAP repeat
LKTILITFGLALALVMPTSLYSGSLFRTGERFKLGGYPVSVAAADVNGDGIPDLVVAHYYGFVSVLLGDSHGRFHYLTYYRSGSAESRAVVVADVNGDGKPDVIVGNHDATVSVLLGNGDGTFQPAVQYGSGGASADSVAIADVNGDLKPDLLVANGSVGASVLLGNGDGTFQQAQTYDTGGATGIAVADINGDGHPDLVVTKYCFIEPKCETGAVAILLGIGDGTFQAGRQYSSGTFAARNITVADVSGDQTPDLLVVNDGGVAVLLGNGDGTFQPAVLCDTGGRDTVGIVVADVNTDGKPDLLVAGSFPTAGLSLLLGNGDGSFQPGEIYSTGGYAPMSVAVADVDGDLMPDAIVASECSHGYACRDGLISVLLNTTKGFVTTTELTSNLNPSVYGQPVTLTASLKSAGPNSPTGLVVFESDGKALGTKLLSGGAATLTTAKLAPGTSSIIATYKGDRYSLKSASAALSQTVLQASSTTTIQSSRNPSQQGKPVKFSVTVTSPTTTVDGTVTLKTDTGILVTEMLRGGKASLTTSWLPQGNNTITATYEGTPKIVGSSVSLVQIVNGK